MQSQLNVPSGRSAEIGLPVEPTSDTEELTRARNSSAVTLNDVIRWQTENRASSKQLRLDKKLAVDRRLAKQITFAEYQALNSTSKEQLAECKKRSQIILSELTRMAEIPGR